MQVNSTTSLPAAFSMHGKSIVVGASGLPVAVSTFGASASPSVDAGGSTAVLAAAGAAVSVWLGNSSWGSSLHFAAWSTTLLAGNGSLYVWRAEAEDTSGACSLTVAGSLDATGYMALDFAVAPGAAAPPPSPGTQLSFALSVPTAAENLLYGMGLGVQGGYFEKLFPSPAAQERDWKWDGINGNNGVWVGSTTGGLLLKLKGEDPLWQASVPFDSKAAPPAPPNWANGGAGGLLLARNGTATGYSGALPWPGGNASLAFRASLLVTPVHNLNLTHHFGLRYAQLGGPSNYTFLAEQGATVVNMHQGNVINPWINYPYLTNELMNATAAAVHELGMRFSVYNTMRELSNRCSELFAMHALQEVLVPGGDGSSGADWLKEHLEGGFLSAWSTPIPQLGSGFVLDAAVRVVALSRWNNYYVEGIQQMMRDFQLDGIYLDEIAYDRITMMRLRKLLDARHGVIDQHSDAGAFCVSPSMIYTEHYPFIDRLWHGEGFPYDTASPDYWLVEMSGLVFGLTADMLRYPGQTPYHFKGMLFAESNRWQGGLDQATVTTDPFVPVALWQLWAEAGISEATLYGWWLEDVLGPAALPVASNVSSSVKVTTYSLPASALLAVASFAAAPLAVELSFNSSILGLPGSLDDFCLFAPQLLPFQPRAQKLALSDSFVVEPGQGYIFRLLPCSEGEGEGRAS
jgi:hypothetical protein